MAKNIPNRQFGCVRVHGVLRGGWGGGVGLDFS